MHEVIDIPTAITPAETATLVELATGGVVLEMGAHFGYSTVVLGKVATVHSCDRHDDSGNYAIFREHLRRYRVTDSVVIHIGLFSEILPTLKVEFDGVFIDGNHDEEDVQQDTEMSWELVKSGGWVAWHDYGRMGVAPVVDPWVADHGLSLTVVEHLAWTRKP